MRASLNSGGAVRSKANLKQINNRDATRQFSVRIGGGGGDLGLALQKLVEDVDAEGQSRTSAVSAVDRVGDGLGPLGEAIHVGGGHHVGRGARRARGHQIGIQIGDGRVQAIPDAHLTFATKSAYQPLFEHFDVPVQIVPLLPTESLLGYRKRLARVRYDIILDLHGSVRSVILSRLLRAQRRVRVNKHVAERRAMVRDKTGLDRPLSALRAYREALKATGLQVSETFPKLGLSAEESHHVQILKRENPISIGIGWGAGWPTKIVPPEVWGSILDELGGEQFTHLHLFGMESDRSAMTAFLNEQQFKRPTLRAEIECGHGLREVMIRIASCTTFVSSDSGLMHLAAALGVPSLGLFGPTHPALGFAPVGPGARAFHAGTECSPCHRHGAAPCYRERRFCFDDLNPAEIARAITEAISTNAGGGAVHV